MKSSDPRTVLRKYGIRPKRSWGQNFLVDRHVLSRSAAACRLTAEDVVVELGAGLGTYTAYLAPLAQRVVAVERDRDLVPVLEQELREHGNVEVVEGNAVGFDFGEVATVAGRKIVVTGNLPYQLSKKLLMGSVEAHEHVARAVFMVQREVADRVRAEPGSKAYGVLSIALQIRAEVEVVLRVPKGAFHPPPKVESAVVRLLPRSHPATDGVDLTWMMRVVSGAFSQRRKTLRNSLRSLEGPTLVEGSVLLGLQQAGIDEGRRAETLSIEEFSRLATMLAPSRVLC